MSRSWTTAYEKVRSEGLCRVNGCKKAADDPAHIAPRSLGGGQAAEAVVPLCRDHHNRFDRERDFDLGPHLTWEEQAECVRVLGLDAAHKRLFPTSHPDLGLLFPKGRR
jgi:hypothetical protein